MISARREFLEAFLGALGAAEIVAWCERESEVSGTLRLAEDAEVLDLSGDEEGELVDFAWRRREEDAPSLLTFRLADVLRRYQLVEIDRMRVSRGTLRTILEQDFDEPVGAGEFDAALDALLEIEVGIREGGEEMGETFALRE